MIKSDIDKDNQAGTDSGKHAAHFAHAFLVGSGILLSRIAGLVRDRVFAHYLGNSDAADAFRAAFRIPNFLQNLFGEGVLSGSFIPVYAHLEAEGKHEEARAVAGAVAGILSLVISLLVLAGIIATPVLIGLIAPGFSGGKRELCIRLVRIFFPGAGMLVFSAWCLGILNSHGKFFLSYTAPVLWNIMIIITLIGFGNSSEYSIAEWTAWGSVAGSAVQVLVQIPLVLRMLKGLHLSLNRRLKGVRNIIRNFFPVFISRGVVQISAYIDSILASFLPTGAVAALAYAQTLYTLPVSLFGMSVSAAELPAMSRAIGRFEDISLELRERLNKGLSRIAFFIVPSATAFLMLGDVVAGAIYQTGKFTASDSIYVWAVLAGSAIGLLASTLGRLYSSAFYALKDTRTPLRFAVIRVTFASAFGYFASMHLPGLIGVETRWGVAGITAASGFCGWIEFSLLRSSLNKRIGKTGLVFSNTIKLWASALIAGFIAWIVKLSIGQYHPVILALLIIGVYGITYLTMAFIFRIPEAYMLKRVKNILKR
jgi:putative peptidoglycan lipid II flippase